VAKDKIRELVIEKQKMKDFTDAALIDENGMRQLHQLLGSPLHSLVLHQTSVKLQGSHHVLSPSFSLRTQRGDYIVVENKWGETPGGWDYGQLLVRSTPNPPGIDRAQKETKANMLTMKPFQGIPPVQKIDIFEGVIASEGNSGPSYDSEHVRYDAAIVFRREDHSAFRLSPEDGPLGRVEFCQLWSDIRHISTALKRRVMITAEGVDFDPPPA